MAFIDKLMERAKKASKHIVLPEGHDPRVVVAADKIRKLGIAAVTVLGTEAEIAKSCGEGGLATRNFQCLDHTRAECLGDFAKTFQELRRKRGKEIGTDAAITQMKDRIFFANMMLRKEMADGLVAGSIASTPDMLRGAFMVTGTAPGIKSGSSCFVMDLQKPSPGGAEVLLYADSGVNPDPDEDQLVDIAMATATTYRALTGAQPKIAFLSFSTRGSAEHESLKKVIAATAKTKARIKEAGLDILVDGELQADAAIVPGVAAKKCPDSPLKGEANVLIFPDLNAGNICYKLTERLAGAGAYGPILQGLAKPVNDLSRGCSADDIVGVAAITVCQAIG
jgi:phosphate acetyltransferase